MTQQSLNGGTGAALVHCNIVHCDATLRALYRSKEGRAFSVRHSNQGLDDMAKRLIFLALIALGGILNVVGAVAQETEVLAAKACVRQAATRDFGIHAYQRHRFIMRCIAELPQAGS
jgi:hypothetical protein